MNTKKCATLGMSALLAVSTIAGATALPQAMAQGGSTITVKSTGDRTSLDKYGAKPLAGATFGLFRVNDENQVVDSNAKPIQTAHSGGDGMASFKGVPAGNYYVKMIDAPQGYKPLDFMTVGKYDGTEMGTRSGYYVQVDGRGNYDLTQERKGGKADNASSRNWTAGIFPAVRDNPKMTKTQCDPLDITVIADLSYSTHPQFDARNLSNSTYHKAMIKMIDDLAAGGNTTLRIGTFAGNAPSDSLAGIFNIPRSQGPITEAFDMSDKAQVQAAKDRITKGYKGNAPLMFSEWQKDEHNKRVNGWKQGTNWDAGLYQHQTAGVKSDLVVFFTDGMPTIDQPGVPEDPFILQTRQRNLEYAVASANAIKAQGTKVVGVYVDNNTQALGDAPGTGRSFAANNLKAISGDEEGLDYHTTDWADIGEKLAKIPDDVCSTDEIVETPKKLQVSKEVTTKATKVGDMTTFTVKVKNASSVTAKNVQVKDEAIKGLSDVKFVNTETGSAVESLWKVGDLKPGETKTATVEAKATGSDVDNSVSAEADNIPKPNVDRDKIQRNNGDPSGDTDQHDRVDYQISTPPEVTQVTKKRENPNVKVAKKVDEQKTYRIGDTVNYTITVKNDSKVKAEDVRVKDVAQEGLSNLKLSDPSVGKADGDTWKVGDLKPGQTETIKVSATITGTGEVDNKAHVSAKGLPTKNSGEIQRNNDNVDDDTDQRDAVTVNVEDDPAPQPVQPVVKPTAGPKVNTGGGVAQSFFNKVANIFR